MSHSEPSTGASPGGHGGFIPPAPADLNAVLEGYEFIELLGRGGMGAVYKARQKSLDRLVAIKILPPNLTGDTEGEGFHFAERFQREARAMARLSHPHIIGVIDFGQTLDGQYYFVMEFIEGTDLHALIRGGELTTNHVLGWISQICDALQYAHSRGIVHRDIKPANIMISLEGQVKVADFGLAKLTGPDEVDSKLTMTNMAMGTPDYVAPEALEMGVEVDHRADLYAVGVMLYEMLTGKVPRGAWKSPSVQVAGLDPRFDALIERAMDADRESRHQHASEISATLYEISTTPLPTTPRVSRAPRLVVGKIPERTGEGPPSGEIPPQALSSKRPNGLAVGVLVGFVVVGLLAMGWWLFQGTTAPQEVVSFEDTSLPAATQVPSSSQPEVAKTLIEEPPAQPLIVVPEKEAPAVSASAAAPEPAVAVVPLPPPSEVLVFEGHQYQFLPGLISWPEAKAKAESAGGHLATISRAEEHEWIRSTFAVPTLQHNQLFWVDGKLEEKDPDWTFHDGSTERGFRWGGGRPYYRKNYREDIYPGYLAMRNYMGDFAIEDCAADGANTSEDWRKRIVGYLVEWDDEGAAKPALTATSPTSPASPTMPAPSPAEAPVPVDTVSLRLRELEQTFQDAYAKQVTPTHQAAVDKLNTSYLGRLDREIAAASQAGQLEQALAFREEKTQVESLGTVPPTDSPETTPGLLPLRQTYRSAQTDLVTKRDQIAGPLLDAYDRALGAYQDELTKAQNLDGAIRVKAVRDYAASRREPADESSGHEATSLTKSVPSAPSLQAPVAPPLAADQVLPPPVKATPEEVRELVEWCVGVRKGKVTIQDGNQTIIVESLEQIPKGKFALVDLYIYELAMDEDGKARLETLGRVAELESVFFHKNPGTMPMEVFRGATNLKSLRLTPTEVDDAALAHLSGLKKLEELKIGYMVKQFTGTGLGYINEGLLTLEINSPTLSSEGLTYLPRFKKLQQLDLSNNSLGGRGTTLKDSDLAGLAALPDLIRLEVREQTFDGSFLDYLPKNSKLEVLALSNMKNFRTEHLSKLGKLRNLKRLHLPPGELTKEIMTVIAGLDQLTELLFDPATTFNGEVLAGVSGFKSIDFVMFGAVPLSDAGWAAIAKAMPGLGSIDIGYNEDSKATMTPEGFANALAGLEKLTKLQLNGAKFSDAWTPHIAKLKHVDYLMLTYGRITDEGVKPLMTLPLWYLRLDGTLVTDAVIPILKQCPTLHDVPVGGTKMSDAGKAELKQWLEVH